MSDILKYNSWDTTDQALAEWHNIDELERALHVLQDTPEYRVYVQAKANKANMEQQWNIIHKLPIPDNNACFVPEEFGNVK